MYALQAGFSGLAPALFFVALVVLGGFFLLNLTLAVIWNAFEQPPKSGFKLTLARKEALGFQVKGRGRTGACHSGSRCSCAVRCAIACAVVCAVCCVL